MKYLQQFVTTNINVGGGIDDSQTTGIVLQSLNNIDTTKPSVACLSWSDPLDTSVAEWVTYTSINSTTNELQGVTRGAEGYSAKTHLNQAVVAFPLSKSHINELNDAVTTITSGTQTFTGDKTFDTAITSKQIATPANPASGYNKIYFKSDNKAYILTSAGVETEVGGGGTTTPEDGWLESGETWTYASADDPTFTFTIAGVDLTTKYSAGMRIKLTQTTVKYFIITAVAFSTNTTITVYGGTDYDLANATITNPYYSTQKAPQGFPLDPSKWMVTKTDGSERSQSNPTQNVWYNLGSVSISVPIGVWIGSYVVWNRHTRSAGTNMYSTLSSANNSESNTNSTMGKFTITDIADDLIASPQFFVTTTSKTTYYFNSRTTISGCTSIVNKNNENTLRINLLSAYL